MNVSLSANLVYFDTNVQFSFQWSQ